MGRRAAQEGKYILLVGNRGVFVQRKPIKNMYIRIGKDLSVQVTAPLRAKDGAIADFVAAHEEWIRRQLLRQRDRQAEERRQEERAEDYRRELQERMEALIPRCEARTGKKAGCWKVRKMRSRWGSCQPRTGEIHISLYLAAFPEECLEYVMIHELVHLYVANHGPRFRAYMDRFLPDWRDRRARLRESPGEE